MLAGTMEWLACRSERTFLREKLEVAKGKSQQRQDYPSNPSAAASPTRDYGST